jgi:hypothetical protein
MHAACRPSKIGLRSAACVKARASEDSDLRTPDLRVHSKTSLTQILSPSHVQVPSVSSVSEIASCHIPRECTPFRVPTISEERTHHQVSISYPPSQSQAYFINIGSLIPALLTCVVAKRGAGAGAGVLALARSIEFVLVSLRFPPCRRGLSSVVKKWVT